MLLLGCVVRQKLGGVVFLHEVEDDSARLPEGYAGVGVLDRFSRVD